MADNLQGEFIIIMKKLIFGLIATVMVINYSIGQTNKDYFLQMDAVKAAEIHNQVLNDIITIRKKNPDLSIKDALLQIKMDLSTTDRLAIYEYISKNNDATQNYNNVLLKLKSDKAKQIYSTINTLIINSKDYATLVKSIDNELLNANNSLSGFDLKVIQIFAETSKSSANYWYNIYPSNGGALISGRPPLWVTKDGNGIAQASVGWALGAAIFGGGPATYFVACGVGGALASIWP